MAKKKAPADYEHKSWLRFYREANIDSRSMSEGLLASAAHKHGFRAGVALMRRKLKGKK